MPDSGVNRDESSLKLGERLRSARKARAVSLERIAEALHLDESTVLALEEERFDELGAPVFVRGHLKAYAKLVGLDAEALLSAYEPAEPEEVAPPVVEKRVGRSVTVNPMLLGVSVLVLCVVIALTAYVMQDDDPAPPLSDVGSAPVEPPVIQSSIVADAKPLAAPDSAVVDEDRESPRAAESPSRSTIRVTDPPAAAAPAVVESPSTESVSTESARAESAIVAGVADEVGETVAPPPADAIRLSLLFREESWVEISDVNRRLLFGLQREGRRREVVGEPPISLLLGNAKGVELSVNDEPYVVPSSGVRGKVARFEIGTDVLP